MFDFSDIELSIEVKSIGVPTGIRSQGHGVPCQNKEEQSAKVVCFRNSSKLMRGCANLSSESPPSEGLLPLRLSWLCIGFCPPPWERKAESKVPVLALSYSLGG